MSHPATNFMEQFIKNNIYIYIYRPNKTQMKPEGPCLFAIQKPMCFAFFQLCMDKRQMQNGFYFIKH